MEYAQTEKTYSTETAKSDRPPSVIQELREANERMMRALSVLTERLAPVLRPDYEADKLASRDSVPHPAQAEIRDVLNIYRDQCNRVDTLTERLEV